MCKVILVLPEVPDPRAQEAKPDRKACREFKACLDRQDSRVCLAQLDPRVKMAIPAQPEREARKDFPGWMVHPDPLEIRPQLPPMTTVKSAKK